MKLHLLFLSVGILVQLSGVPAARAQDPENAPAVTDPSAPSDPGNSAKEQESCKIVFNRLYETLYKPNADLDSPSNQQALVQTSWQQANSAFRNTAITKEQLEAIFEGPNAISGAEIDALYFALLSGVGVKSSKPGFFNIVSTLQQINRKHPTLFNGQKDVVERLQRILNDGELQTMATSEPSLVQKLNRNLVASLDNILAQMMKEMKGWGYRNTLDPHVNRSIKLVEFGENTLAALDSIVKADGPIDQAISRHGKELLADETAALQELQNDTPGKIQAHRDAINLVFDNDMANGLPVLVGQLKLRKLAERLEAANAGGKLEQVFAEAIRDMDTLEGILRALRKRQGFTDLDYPGLEDFFLHVRHVEYADATKSLGSKYRSLLDDKAPKTNYSVRAKWKVSVRFQRTVRVETPVYETNSRNERVKVRTDVSYESRYHTEEFDEEGTFKLDASYDELLKKKFSPKSSEVDPQLPEPDSSDYSASLHLWDSDVTRRPHPISATNESSTVVSYDHARESQILREASRMIDTENAVREPLDQAVKRIDQWIERYDSIRGSSTARAEALQGIDESVTALIGILGNEGRRIVAMDAAAVRALWSAADAAHFHERATALQKRNESLIQRLKFFREQVRRQMETLTNITQTPKFAPQLQLIEKLTRTRQLWSGVRHGLLVLATVAGVITYQNPAGKTFLQAQWNKVTSLFKSDDKEKVIIYDAETGTSRNLGPQPTTRRDTVPYSSGY